MFFEPIDHQRRGQRTWHRQYTGLDHVDGETEWDMTEEALQHTGQLLFFERHVLRNARHVDPLIVMVFEFVVLIVILIVVDSGVVVNVVVLGCIGAAVPRWQMWNSNSL